jgi:hypothetical protein
MLRKAALFHLSQLGRRARRAGRFLQLIQRELESPAPIPLRKRLLMHANGFLSASYVMYQFDKNDPSPYLSDFQRDVRTPDVNGVYNVLLNDKLLFGLITRNFPAHEVASFGVIRKGAGRLYLELTIGRCRKLSDRATSEPPQTRDQARRRRRR